MLRLTDAFIWEDLSLTDHDTGSLTMAAWIQRIQRVTIFITSSVITFHVVQSSIRFSTRDDRPLFYEARYPFDTTKSPAYELTNLTQVTNSVCSEILFYRVICVALNNAVSIRGEIVINDIFASGDFHKINA
jgi:hypothetical protein